jgi:hypothetical protein
MVERPTDSEIGWLAGIIDGEGSVVMGISKYKDRRGNETEYFITRLAVSNTEKTIIDKCASIIERLGCSIYHCKEKTKHPTHGNVGNKKVTVLAITGFDSLLAILPVVIPHMYSYKKRRAELMLDYIKLRVPKRGVGDSASRKYTDEERNIVDNIRLIKA